MKQIIPFKKNIVFKTKIGEITSISLDNDLMLKGEDLISGNFYISGSYKMIETSTIEESYSYKIPCEIAISDEYDTFDATVDIDDFYYEIIDDEILSINIIVAIDNLKKKEKIEPEETEFLEVNEEERCIEEENEEEKLEEKDDGKVMISENGKNGEKERDNNSFFEVQESIKKQNDTYLTYKVYIFKEGDSIEKVLEKYSITKDDLSDYNDLDSIRVGSKIVIPSTND